MAKQDNIHGPALRFVASAFDLACHQSDKKVLNKSNDDVPKTSAQLRKARLEEKIAKERECFHAQPGNDGELCEELLFKIRIQSTKIYFSWNSAIITVCYDSVLDPSQNLLPNIEV